MFKRKWPRICQERTLVFLLIMALMGLNFFISLKRIPGYCRYWPQAITQFPGYAVLPLKPYLKDIHFAGYYTDRYGPDFWNNAHRMFNYQRAQYALSPTMLDVEKAFEYDLIVFECRKAGCQESLFERYPLREIVNFNGHFGILKRTQH